MSIVELKKIANAKGDIYRALKSSEDSYHGFGEGYFTNIHAGEIKGWKKHNRMVLNLIVPVGLVRFHVYYEKTEEARSYDIGVEYYARLTIQPGIWVAFEGLSNETSLILNLASIEHDPEEAEHRELKDIKIKG
ncbi:dTDP-4-dehydrorhamnose 3,5-epimerase [Vibrio coralliilyticus]|uniref:dTDP-4-dehydrorhamnose 3,5-epimerase n=1 Tax=Vibrio coralliilyticus TaxID=190893 RepID=UPI001E42C002|nr:dTDP-4-dehydrorhamnose 3,5-epimerase [Vibrio coralliilyticus]MCC2524562.1 dTDP-4-dehydrorhamnose 3,5-epimerase [Vibrio coralliilyticus]